MNKTSSNDVLKYLEGLRKTKREIGPNYVYSFDEGIYTIFNSENIPFLSLTQRNFEIFQEIEV